MVKDIVTRHKSGQNSGLFGLRRTGKTSVIFGLKRALDRQNYKCIIIDCQDPSFHRRRWNHALYHIIMEVQEQTKISLILKPEEAYTEEKASHLFVEGMQRVVNALGDEPILIVFDEIENITFDISPSDHWANEYDFIYFWQSIRSAYQQYNLFTFMLVGTNPMCVEVSRIKDKDNPIYSQIPYQYIPGFKVAQTREMVRKLGRIMGIRFEEEIYTHLTEDFGGIPFLMRQMCSIINRISSKTRPVDVGKPIYLAAKPIFEREYSHYVKLTLEVLELFYKDEYDMLDILAGDEYDCFMDFVASDPQYLNHLLGYGIISENQGRYSFRIESIKEYLLNKTNHRKVNPSNQDVQEEISSRRNKLEPKLRNLVRAQLRANWGLEEATNKVIICLGEKKHRSLSYNELFDPHKSNIYFLKLNELIISNWEIFSNIFSGLSKEDFSFRMRTINKHRKSDSHAATISKEDFSHFIVCINDIENKLDDFLG